MNCCPLLTTMSDRRLRVWGLSGGECGRLTGWTEDGADSAAGWRETVIVTGGRSGRASEGDSSEEQRVGLTPPSEDEKGEGSSSTLVDESANSGEVAAGKSSEQKAHVSYKIEGQAPP